MCWAVLIMGIIVELGALKLNYSPEVRAFLTTGILGGFTTFSHISLDGRASDRNAGDWAARAHLHDVRRSCCRWALCSQDCGLCGLVI
jgi:hypothetical protein